jgi:sterol desaturase/sphingolipid hydroxylase (fatty acid hydroxylase superfamily)
MNYLIQILSAIIYINAFEWATHKYLLHGLGRNPKSIWSFHWVDHHKNVRRNHFYDLDYKRPLSSWNAQTKEIVALLVTGLAHLPLVFIFPVFYATVVCNGLYYYYVHRRSHLDPDWAKRRLPWHYDHHMCSNQNANWCVSFPWFDWVMGTRIRK